MARHNTFPRKPHGFPSFTSARAPEHGDACDRQVGTSRLLLSPVLDEKYQAGNGNERKKVKEQLHFFFPLSASFSNSIYPARKDQVAAGSAQGWLERRGHVGESGRDDV